MSFLDGGPLPVKRFNVVVCGAAGVGKTSLVRAFAVAEAVEEYKATVGMAYELWNGFPDEVAEPACELQLHWWDLGGAPQYRASHASAYQNAQVVLGVFDLRSPDTLASVLMDCKALQRPVWVVGTHADSGERAMSAEEAREAADEYGMPYVECCAIDPQGVRECLQPLLVYLYETIVSEEEDDGYVVEKKCCGFYKRTPLIQ